MRIEFVVDKNSAGFHSLKKINSDGAKVMVMPLGMDVNKANAAAIEYINLLKDPNAFLITNNEPADRIISALKVLIPFERHLNKPISTVLIESPDYLVWIYKTYNAVSPKIGEVWRALDVLASDKQSLFAKQLSIVEPKATLAYVGSVGDEVKLDINVIKVIKLKSKFSTENYKIIAQTDGGDFVYTIGGSKPIRALRLSQNLKIRHPISISASIEAHEEYKGQAQTRLSQVKIDNSRNTIVTGLMYCIEYQNDLKNEYLLESFSKLKPLASPLVMSRSLVDIIFEPSCTTSNEKSLKKAVVMFKMTLAAVLIKEEISELIESFENEDIPGVVINGVYQSVLMEKTHE